MESNVVPLDTPSYITAKEASKIASDVSLKKVWIW